MVKQVSKEIRVYTEDDITPQKDCERCKIWQLVSCNNNKIK
jgi:hypothetical protein